MKTKTARTCLNGHKYFKSSDCPVCPICENGKKPLADFYAGLSAPAKRALENAGILSLENLINSSKNELMALHGFGKKGVEILVKNLIDKGLQLND
jgi:DNA-directed RNA polymerase alpha subunit